MLYMEKPLERKEEGVAIFSHYPIISSSYRLLSRLALPLLCQDVMTMLSLYVCVCVCVCRNDTDSEDYHQRICLHAEILTPQFGSVSRSLILACVCVCVYSCKMTYIRKYKEYKQWK